MNTRHMLIGLMILTATIAVGPALQPAAATTSNDASNDGFYCRSKPPAICQLLEHGLSQPGYLIGCLDGNCDG